MKFLQIKIDEQLRNIDLLTQQPMCAPTHRKTAGLGGKIRVCKQINDILCCQKQSKAENHPLPKFMKVALQLKLSNDR